MFVRLADQYRVYIQDLVMSLQALAIVLEQRGYLASCYTCGNRFESASFMVSLQEGHLIRFLVSECSISWTEMRDDRELMRLEGTEAIRQLQELAVLIIDDMLGPDPEAAAGVSAESQVELHQPEPEGSLTLFDSVH